MTSFDVAIVGAGPAGSRAARQLARGGARVALVDGSHPREKPCGGGVTGRALALAGRDGAAGGVAIDAAWFEHRARRVRVEIAETRRVPARLEVIPRRTFDGMLLHDAQASGATLVSARVTALSRIKGGWEVRTRDLALQAPWIIGADGANSFVRRTVGQAFPRQDLSIATGYFVHGVSSRQVEVGFVDEPSGYLWSFPRPDHLAVGVCAQADTSTPHELQRIALDWIRAHVGAADARLERYSWPIPSLSSESLGRETPAGPGWMLAGDAAGMVDPITREGIYFALLSGEAAAASLLTEPTPDTAYLRRTRAEVYDELRRAARLKARFFRPRFLALLIRALDRSPGIREVMADLIAGEQPYRGLRRRLLRTFEIRLMLELFGL